MQTTGVMSAPAPKTLDQKKLGQVKMRDILL